MIESKLQLNEDLRSSIRYKTNNLPMNLMSRDLNDFPARLSNVSSGGLEILCSHYAAQQLSKSEYSSDGPINIVAEILENDNSKPIMLRCKVAYIQQNHSPNDYCSDAVGMEILTDNLLNNRLLRLFINKIS
jgi:hypothetical protein